MKPITVAVAGCGSRGYATYAKCQSRFPEKMKIVTCADIDPEKRERMRREFDLAPELCFNSAEEMLAKEKLADVLFVCTPDRIHYSEAMKGLEKGYHLLLEKPISVTEEQCKDLEALALEKHRLVVVCHVLRYTVFYQKIKQLLDSGSIGEMISMQAIERVCYWHQAHSFVRGNWRNSDLSSPMILQKSCHDMDIFLWLAGKHCKKVSSFGSLRHFTREFAPLGAPHRCTEGCPASEDCPFNAVKFYLDAVKKDPTAWPANVLTIDPNEESILEALKTGPYGRCVYDCDNNVVDHQVVNLELEDGITVDFNMSAFTAKGGRLIRIMGTKGEIEGDMENNLIRLLPFGKEETCIDVTKLTQDFSGHGGGDARLLEDFLDLLLKGQKEDALTSVSRSVESHLVALAAEKSRIRGEVVVL